MRETIPRTRNVLEAQGVAERWEGGPIMRKIAKAFGFLFFKSVDSKVRCVIFWKLTKMIHWFAGK